MRRILSALLAFCLAGSLPSAARLGGMVSNGYEYSIVLKQGVGLLGTGANSTSYTLGLGNTTTKFNTYQLISSSSDWSYVDAGMYYSLALKTDSTLWGWGRGSGYVFGTGNENSLTVPTQIGSSKWIKIVAGVQTPGGPYTTTSFGIRADSTLWGWGTNTQGQIGDGSTTQRTVPVQIGSAKWLDVHMNKYFTLGIQADSSMYGWGYNQFSVLGDPGIGNPSSPTKIGTAKWIQVVTGGAWSHGIKADSTLWAWGAHGANGQTGLGSTSGQQNTPAQIGSSKWLRVVAGGNGSLGLRSDSTLWRWGTNAGGGSNASTPTQIGSSKWVDVDIGYTGAVGIDASGNYHGWGTNSGEVGDGAYTTRTSPTAVSAFKTVQTLTFTALASTFVGAADYSPGATASSGLTVSYASSDTTVAKIVNGLIRAVGAGTATITASQAGDASYYEAASATQSLTVVLLPHPHKDRKVAAGSYFSLAIVDGVGLYASGSATGYTLGTGDLNPRTRFEPIASGNWRHVEAGGAYSWALKGDSTLWGWGTTTDGFGDGVNEHRTPTQLGTDKWITVTAGMYPNTHFGIRADSTLWVWGAPGDYIHGDGTLAAKAAPTQIGSDKWLVVCHFNGHVLAIKSDRTLWAWGSASQGRLGTGATTGFVQTPTQVGNATWTMLASTSIASIGIQRDSTLWSWGSNSIGLTGRGLTSGSTTTPTQIGTGQKWIWVEAGQPVVSALRSDSTLWTWGANGAGAAAQGNASGPTVPTQVGTDKWLQSAIGSSHGLGITAAGQYQAWGSNYYGEVGDSTVTLRTTPVAVKFNRTQTITFGALPAKTLADSDFAPGATASSGLTVAYASSDLSVATIVSGQIHIVGVGSATITGSQAGDAVYDAASATQTLTVTKASQTLSFTPLPSKTFGDPSFTLSASATSGVSVTFASSDTTVATVSHDTVTIIGAGSTNITASAAATSIYLAAPDSVQTLTVNKAAQAISFTPPSSKTYGGGSFALTASATSGGSVTFASSDTSVAKVSGSTVSLVGAGSTTITASSSATANYLAAPDSAVLLTVNKASQTLTFPAPAGATYGDSPFTLGASSSSGLPVSYVSSDTTVAKVSGDTVTVIGAGTATLTAAQGGNANYLAAVDSVQTLTVGKAGQSISFAALPTKTYGDAAFSLSASASSGATVTFTSSNPAVATVSGSMVTVVGAGTTEITASASATSNHSAAPDSTLTLTVNKASQVLSFAQPAAKTYGTAPFTLGVSSSSGLPVTYASSDTTVAKVSGDTVTVRGAGTATITASQSGNANYLAAVDSVKSLTVNKAAQSIAFGPVSSKTFGDGAFALSAAATSGIPVTFASSNTAVAIVSGSTVTVVGAGTANLTASAPATANYLAAPDSVQTLTVGKAGQSISFASLPTKTYGDAAFSLSASASSGATVTFTSSNPAVATVSGSTVNLVGAGSVILTASAAATTNYSAAPDSAITLTVNKASQILTFPAVAAVTYGVSPFALGVTSSSGLAITYASSDTTVAKVSGDTVMVVGAGTATLTASQGGNANYLAAVDSVKTLIVNKAVQSISFAPLTSKNFGDGAFAMSASATSGAPVTFVSSNTAVATLSGSTVTVVGAGTANITASAAATANYLAAPDSVQTLMVGKATQTLTFPSPAPKTHGDGAFVLGVSSSSGLPVTYASSDTSVAKVSNDTVTVIGAGTASITASQAGNANYLAAVDSVKTLTVHRATQAISFAPLSSKTYGDPVFALSASTPSGAAITFVSSNPSVATVSGSTVTVVGAGMANITASASATADFSAASDATQALTVHKASQTISFASLASKVLGDSSFALTATSTSGLPVTYASSNPAVATVSGSTVTLVGAGSTTLKASQAGNANYVPAADTVQILMVAKMGQGLTFPAIAAKTFGDPDFEPGAVAASGLPVSYASSDTSVAKWVAGKIRIVGAGSAVITASQAGDSTYQAVPDLARTLTVNKATQTLAFPALPPKLPGDSAFAPGATSTSGLPISFSSSNLAVAVIEDGKIRVTGVGSATITATQDGNSNYQPAAAQARVLDVGKIAQTIAFAALPEKIYGDSAFTVSATASSNLPVSFMSSNPAVAAIAGSTVTLLAAGTVRIIASQAGDSVHAAAPDTGNTLVIGKAAQTLSFPELPARTFGAEDFPPGATTSSGLTVAYASSNPSVATMVDGKIHLLAAGLTEITASQPGDGNHLPAAPQVKNLIVLQAAQVLTFDLGADTLKTVGDPAFKLTASSSLGLPVAFASSDTTVAAILGDSVRVGKAGLVVLTASQSGTAQFGAAASISRTLRVRHGVPAALAIKEMSPNGEAPQDTALRLAWAHRATATGYRLQSTRDTLAAALLDTLLADTSFDLRASFAERLFWRVAAANATGQSPFSPYAAFTVRPRPPLPIDIARIPELPAGQVSTALVLALPKVENATGYHVQLALDTASPPVLDTIVNVPILSLRDLTPGQAYVWRVAPINGVSEAPFTPFLSFKVKDKDDGSVGRTAVVDSAKKEEVKVSDLVGLMPTDTTLTGVKITLVEEKKAPLNLPDGFLPLTGRIDLDARVGSTGLSDGQLTVTLTPPDTSLGGKAIGRADVPLVYTLDSATGELRVIYDLERDSAGRIILPLSKGKSFLLAVDTIPPKVEVETPSAALPAGSAPVLRGSVDDNIRNCRAVLRYRKGGEETFDSVAVTVGPDGRFEMPLSLQLDGAGFEYALSATDGRNIKATPGTDIPVAVKGLASPESLPSLQWRLFALPTLPARTRWEDLLAGLGEYGQDWKLFERGSEGLRELGEGLQEAKAGSAYWLKSRLQGFTPKVAEGRSAPISRPFEIVLPPRSWRSFGNPYLFPVSWEKVLAATAAPAGSLQGPYGYRDTSWVAPFEIPALAPWEGYYVRNASDDTVRLRIPAIRAPSQAAARIADLHLRWEVRGADGKDAGNHFGALPSFQAKRAASGAAALSEAESRLWQAPKPESPDAGLRTGFVPAEAAADGLLQTDFRSLGAAGGAVWKARLSGLRPGQRYTSTFPGFEGLQEGMALGVADPATGTFRLWKEAGESYVFEAQAGETTRELEFYSGTTDYVRSRGEAFAAAHPIALAMRTYPNPARAFTVIRFAVPALSSGMRPVRVSVYDLQGRLVKRLSDGPLAIGWHTLRWDLRDTQGRPVAAGSYRLLLEAGDRRLNQPLQILP